MKLDNVSFPHPVLGLIADDGAFTDEVDVMGLFEVSQTIRVSSDVRVSVEYELMMNPQLETLLAQGIATFACEVSCPKTAFRAIFLSGEKNQEIVIPIDDLRDQVVFQYFILAGREFRYVDQGGWHSDYQGQSFDIEPGMFLAYGGMVKHMLERAEQSTPRGASLVEVNSMDSDSGPFEVDIGGETLNIFLPRKTFIYFETLYSSDPKYAATFHAALVVPALVYALSTMAADVGKDYRDKRWFQALETKLSKDERFRDLLLADITSAKALEIAQRIIGNPFSALTETLAFASGQEGED